MGAPVRRLCRLGGPLVALIAFYISGHGLGHASRQVALMRAILARQPDVRIVVRTAAQPWAFARVAGAVELQPFEADTGMVQIDSLRLDEEETARQAARFYADFDRRADEEAGRLRAMGASLVVGDIPPLAFAAAARAGLRSIAVGNFTWDWIYAIYPAFERLAPDVMRIVTDAYRQATLALRMPLHGGFEPMEAVTRDIPLVARKSSRDPAETRRLLGVGGDRPVVFVSFGAYGAEIPIDVVSRPDRFTLVPPVRLAPAGLDYEDLVAAADVVVSKPGYGIISECIANDTALLYTSRGRFAEYDVFVREMPRFLRCQYLSQEDLFAGRWADAVDALLAQPSPPVRPPIDGADVAARIVLETL